MVDVPGLVFDSFRVNGLEVNKTVVLGTCCHAVVTALSLLRLSEFFRVLPYLPSVPCLISFIETIDSSVGTALALARLCVESVVS